MHKSAVLTDKLKVTKFTMFAPEGFFLEFICGLRLIIRCHFAAQAGQ